MWSRPVSWSSLAIALLLAFPSRPSAASSPPPLPLFTMGAVRRSLAMAAGRLERAECRALYEEFRDTAGATLAERLRVEGATPADHLRSLHWQNGAGHPLCRSRRVFLVTRVGSRVVLVCPEQFGDLAARQPGYAAGLLLHEQLHALGLGENPPASEDITRRVLSRCGW